MRICLPDVSCQTAACGRPRHRISTHARSARRRVSRLAFTVGCCAVCREMFLCREKRTESTRLARCRSESEAKQGAPRVRTAYVVETVNQATAGRARPSLQLHRPRPPPQACFGTLWLLCKLSFASSNRPSDAAGNSRPRLCIRLRRQRVNEACAHNRPTPRAPLRYEALDNDTGAEPQSAPQTLSCLGVCATSTQPSLAHSLSRCESDLAAGAAPAEGVAPGCRRRAMPARYSGMNFGSLVSRSIASSSDPLTKGRNEPTQAAPHCQGV